MSIVAGIDFGTQSVRVSIIDSERGRLGSGVATYPLHRRREDPDYAAQSHADHLTALESATRQAIASAGINGHDIAAVAVDTTGSTIVPLDERLKPLDDYYLWCDHRSWREAAEITTEPVTPIVQGEPATAEAGPIKIGLIAPFSGAFAGMGKQVEGGVRAYLDQHGSKVAGREIELLVKDVTGVAPDVAKSLAQGLLVRDKVDFLAGFVLTLAAAPASTPVEATR